MRRYSLLTLLVVWLASPAAAESPFEQALNEPEAGDGWLFRGQSPPPGMNVAPLVTPPPAGSQYYPGTVSPGVGGDPFVNPGNPMYPGVIQDPFANGGQPIMSYGLNGPQPRKYGWQARYDLWWIPGTEAEAPATGDLEVMGVDIEKKYTGALAPGWSWAFAPQFNYRSISGPVGTATTDLPENAYRFGLDLSMMSDAVGGWNWEFGFTPSLGTDFSDSIGDDAFMFDGRILAHWRWSPQWMWTIGAVYWDRVDDIVLPYAGAVWTPNDLWEFRLIFPEPRVSVFVGAPWGVPTWLYVRGEYHVESYEMHPQLLADQTRVQFADIRVAGGLRWETGTVTSFIEAGYVFNREVKYARFGSDYDVESGFIGRIGLRY